VPSSFRLGDRLVGPDQPPLVIAEVGINHEGELDKALQMIDEVADLGGECVKFQSHVVEDEMIPNDVIPGNADESIWDIMVRCALDEEAERALKERAESRGLLFLSTPFSRAAADRLEGMGVAGYKIGSGECNNYPLIEHVASFGKPMIVSTGMNDLASVSKTVAILRRKQVPYALLHCTSMYPTPYEKIRLGALTQMGVAFPDAVLGLSDHSPSIYPMLGSVALGASILERHYTSDMSWPGPDIEVSMDPTTMGQLLEGSRAIHAALGGTKEILPEEQPTIDFAYACVVTTAPIAAGERFDASNTWVKRPGTGEILAEHYEVVIGRTAANDLPADVQVGWSDLA
jgi:sialic acid synthase SpsE